MEIQERAAILFFFDKSGRTSVFSDCVVYFAHGLLSMVESVSEDASLFASTSQSFQSRSNLLSQRLEYVIVYSLDQCQFRSAVFLAERLVSHLRSPGHSEEQREYAQYLLATSHYRQGKPEAAWAVLEGCRSPRCRYLFAQCCLDLRRYVECNGVLEFLLEDATLAKCPTAGKHYNLMASCDKNTIQHRELTTLPPTTPL